MFNTFGNDTKGLGGRCGLRPSAPSSALRHLATSSRCYPVHGLLPEKIFAVMREKYSRTGEKISRQHSSSRHNPGAETCQAGTLITRHTAHSPEQTRLTPGAVTMLRDMSRVTRGLESVTQLGWRVSFVVKFHQVQSIIVRRQEEGCRRNATLVLFIQSQTLVPSSAPSSLR